MTIDENHIEKLCNTVAETIVGAFERITIDDVNMYKLGYNKAIDDFVGKFIYKAVCEGCSGCCNCYEESRQSECEDYKAYIEIAEQLKEGGENVRGKGKTS